MEIPGTLITKRWDVALLLPNPLTFWTPKRKRGGFLKLWTKGFLFAVTVIWASLHFGHPHSQNPSDIDIPCNPNLTQIAEVIEKGMPISLGFWKWGRPYHYNNATSESRRNWVELTFAKTFFFFSKKKKNKKKKLHCLGLQHGVLVTWLPPRIGSTFCQVIFL